MRNCVFCKIVRGELPSVTLYEDDFVVAFFDVAPIHPGHTLIVPRDHHTSLTTVPEGELARMMQVAPRLGQALVRSLDEAAGFNLHLANGEVAGQIVEHAHLHVIPRSPTDGFSWGWRTTEYASESERDHLAEEVRHRLAAKTP